MNQTESVSDNETQFDNIDPKLEEFKLYVHQLNKSFNEEQKKRVQDEFDEIYNYIVNHHFILSQDRFKMSNFTKI